MLIWKGCVCLLYPFWMGCIVYPLIELGWRGHTHPAMALAGGVSVCALEKIRHTQQSRPLWQQALRGGLAITGIEYAFGAVCNRRYRIWDYRCVPLNLHGQVCVPYTLAWCALSAAYLGGMRCLSYSSRARMSAM